MEHKDAECKWLHHIGTRFWLRQQQQEHEKGAVARPHMPLLDIILWPQGATAAL
jgi:hypothetical protein